MSSDDIPPRSSNSSRVRIIRRIVVYLREFNSIDVYYIDQDGKRCTEDEWLEQEYYKELQDD